MHNIGLNPVRVAGETAGNPGLQRNLDDLRGRVRRMRAHMLVHTHALARLDQDLAGLESELHRLAVEPQGPRNVES